LRILLLLVGRTTGARIDNAKRRLLLVVLPSHFDQTHSGVKQ
jgi:hypothetical protein